jgi:hypothetical protein
MSEKDRGGHIHGDPSLECTIWHCRFPDARFLCGARLTDGSRCVLPAGHLGEPDDHENENGVSLSAEPARVHKAQAGPEPGDWHCTVCGQAIKTVPGGNGPVLVHSDSGAVAAPNPPVFPMTRRKTRIGQIEDLAEFLATKTKLATTDPSIAGSLATRLYEAGWRKQEET